MLECTRSIAVCGALLALGTLSTASAQIMLPTRQHDTLDFELKSLRDDITLYMGDPQELLLMDIRPKLTTQPRVTYSGQANAVLQIVDQELIDARGTRGAPPDGDSKDAPYGQKWEVRLSPSGPTSFVLQLEQGESSIDLTDFQVSSVDVSADGTILDIGFRDPNPVAMGSCSLHTQGGALKFHGLVNAQAKEIALFVPETACDIEVTGKEFAGETAITLQGVPASMLLVVSRKVGVRITGPPVTIAHFASANMVQDGDAWVSKNYDKSKCRMRLTFAEEIPKLVVKWN